MLTTLVAFTQTAFTYQDQAKQSSETLKDSKLRQTAFTYQEQLKEGNVPANGVYTIRFELYTAQSGGHKLGVVIKDDVVLTNGSFTVQLDFGSEGINSNESWLEVGMRPARSTDPYTVLSPRQRLTPTRNGILALAEPWSRIGVPVGFQRGVGADLVTADKIADDAVTGAKISERQVVNKINSPKDAVTLAAGDNPAVTPSGNTLPIAAQDRTEWTNDKGVVRLTTDTNSVGIGIREPTAKLDVDGSIRARGPIRSGNSMTFNGLDHTITATDVLSQLFSKQIRIGFSNTPTPNPVTFPDIKVGIGTLTPGATLHVDQPNVPNGGEAARVTFQNLINQQTAIGVNAVESAVKTNNGGHIGVNAQTSISAGSQKGAAVGRLAQASGFFANGTITGVLGQSTPSALTNGLTTSTSFGVGGLFTGGPAAGTLTLNATGTYWVGGVYGRVSGTINTTPGAGAVAGVIGIDTNTGTATSYAGYFSGRVRVTNLSGLSNNLLVTATTNGTLNHIAFTGNANDVLLGNGTFGAAPGGGGWLLLGNAVTNPPTHFLGTTDLKDLVFKTNSTERMRITTLGNVGIGTLNPTATLHINGTTRFSGIATLDSGVQLQAAASGGARMLGEQGNTPARPAIGFFSTNGVDDGGLGNGIFRPVANTMAFATGSTERMRITSGGAVGIGTLTPNEQLEITGNFRLPASTASVGVIKSGANRFIHNFGGTSNFFAGVNAGNLTLSGSNSTGVGGGALQSLTTGNGNTAIGFLALRSNTTGGNNTAVGNGALLSNATGVNNTAVGQLALENTTGNGNAAVGTSALVFNTTGTNNTALGNNAGANVSLTSGTNNIFLGASAGSSLTNGSNNIYISNNGAATESNTMRIGSSQTRSFVAGIRGVTTGVANAIPVLIDSSGQLGTLSSSRRFKEHIEDMGAASEVLYRLRPVSFLYKPEYGGRPDLRQFGLIAEEVAKVAPELVAYDGQGQPYTVYYQFLAPMLLNELQKKDTEIEKLRARLDALEKLVEALTKK